MHPATLRRLGPDDLADYRHIRLTALATAPDAFTSTYDAEAARPDVEHIERLLTSSVFGAYLDGRIVGMLGCRRYDSARETHKAFLWGFYVEPFHRQSGLAGLLIEASLDTVPAGVEQILLTVVATNHPAISLYKRFGFRPYGTEPRSLKSAGFYAEEHLMVLFLSDRRSP